MREIEALRRPVRYDQRRWTVCSASRRASARPKKSTVVTSPLYLLSGGFPLSRRYGGSTSMKVELNRDWSEFLCALIAHRVRFVLVGGHAVAGHGEPRLTEDLDVFVEPTLANARRLRDALVDFGFGNIAPPAEELAIPDRIVMLGRKPWRIDVLTGIDGVTFAEVWASRVEA
jgi:hypothetical protein